MLHVALEVPLTPLGVRGGRQRGDAQAAVVEGLRYAFYHAALASGVAALEDDKELRGADETRAARGREAGGRGRGAGGCAW